MIAAFNKHCHIRLSAQPLWFTCNRRRLEVWFYRTITLKYIARRIDVRTDGRNLSVGQSDQLRIRIRTLHIRQGKKGSSWSQWKDSIWLQKEIHLGITIYIWHQANYSSSKIRCRNYFPKETFVSRDGGCSDRSFGQLYNNLRNISYNKSNRNKKQSQSLSKAMTVTIRILYERLCI